MQPARVHVRSLHWGVACAVAFLLLGLFVLGGARQNLDVSGLCTASSDCHGWALPVGSGNGAADAIGQTHRAVAALTGLLALVLAGIAAARLRDDRRIVYASLIALGLIAVQVATTVIRVSTTWHDLVIGLHFSATALLLATAVYLIMLPTVDRHASTSVVPSWTWFRPGLIQLTCLSVFGLLLSGSVASTREANPACAAWPLCFGNQSDSGLSTWEWRVHLLHRGLSLVAGVLIVATVITVLRGRRTTTLARGLAAVVLVVIGAELVIGAVENWGSASGASGGIHFGLSGIAWGALVALTMVYPSSTTAAAPSIRARSTSDAQARRIALLRGFVRVSKPGIVLLLLITTLGAMLAAGPGWPSLSLVLATLFGGALAAAGASAINCYLDRDIDAIMARTRKRPIPTRDLTPAQVLVYGVSLSAIAVVELWLLVNPLAALLSLAGNLFYVIIYTWWLKRRTPQNIVIGGAAGAFPPLVGWAAATGTIGVPALLLFAIIFFWTPPHFWSLALLKANDYRRAGIPMLPVTAGEQATRKQIVLYALVLVATTLLLVPAGASGMVYLAGASVLGAAFIAYAVRMYREDSSRLAWPLFKFSNYYLALLLALLVLDRAVAR